MSVSKTESGDENRKALSLLAEQVEMYQSNHFGSYDKSVLLATFLSLPEALRSKLSRSARGLLRGSDLYYNASNFSDFCSDKTALALSFTPSHGVASLFGTVCAFKDICESYQHSLDLGKLLKLIRKFKIPHEIGDDEGEVILFNVVYRKAMRP